MSIAIMDMGRDRQHRHRRLRKHIPLEADTLRLDPLQIQAPGCAHCNEDREPRNAGGGVADASTHRLFKQLQLR